MFYKASISEKKILDNLKAQLRHQLAEKKPLNFAMRLDRLSADAKNSFLDDVAREISIFHKENPDKTLSLWLEDNGLTNENIEKILPILVFPVTINLSRNGFIFDNKSDPQLIALSHNEPGHIEWGFNEPCFKL